MSFSLRSTMLGACALLALMLPSEAQIKAPAPKPLATPDKILPMPGATSPSPIMSF